MSNGSGKGQGRRPLRIGVCLETSWGYARRIFRGAGMVAIERHVSTRLLDGYALQHIMQVKEQDRLSGLIGAIAAPDCERVARAGIPCVNVSGALRRSTVPQVIPDNLAIGKLAGMHLLGQGARTCVCTGVSGTAFTQDRLSGFTAALKGTGVAVTAAPSRPELLELIRRGPGPVGVFAINDHMACSLLRQLQDEGIRVPEDVLVIGVDNDELLGQTSDPPLSTIDAGFEQVGAVAANLLLRWICEGKRPPEVTLVQPAGLVMRQSTMSVTSDDPVVNAALHIIRQETGEVTLKTLLRRLEVSRSSLERRFRQAGKGSPAMALLAASQERACRLLIDTEMPLPRIADACGLGNVRRLRAVFKRELGTSPEAYRARFRGV